MWQKIWQVAERTLVASGLCNTSLVHYYLKAVTSMEWMARFQTVIGTDLFLTTTSPGYSNGYWELLPQCKCNHSMKLTTYLCLLLRYRMCEVMLSYLSKPSWHSD